MLKKKTLYSLAIATICSYGFMHTITVNGTTISPDIQNTNSKLSVVSPSTISIETTNMPTQETTIYNLASVKEKQMPKTSTTLKVHTDIDMDMDIDMGFGNQIVFISDINLKKCIIHDLNKAIKKENEEFNLDQPLIPISDSFTDTDIKNIIITQQQANKLKSLNADHKNIYNLAGLEYFRNLEYINLGNNPVGSDYYIKHSSNPLAPLGQLPNLQVLDLINCDLEDISGLSDLSLYGKITTLSLSNNFIVDLTPLSNMTSLKNLDLYYNFISDVNPLSDLVNLEFLDLGNNYNYYAYDTILDIDGLRNLNNLKTLNLEQSYYLNDIEPLANLTKLEKLNLNDCEINDISILSNLISLQELYMDNNYVSALTLSNLDKLKFISLEGNPLDIIELKNMPYLTSLNLDYTGIGSIQFENIGLKVLVLASENLTHIDFNNLPQLQELRLIGLTNLDNYNFLTVLPNLKELDLWNIPITDDIISVLSHLSKPTVLQRLHLANNNLMNISFISAYTGLDCLTILDNPITSVEAIGNIPNLKQLYIYRSNISNITPLLNLSHLEFLGLKGNRISTLPKNMDFPSLTGLSLAHNRIQDILPLSSLKTLEYLELSHNKIENILPLESLTSLNRLNLRHNKIQDMSPLNKLTLLDFHGDYSWYWIQENPFIIPPKQNVNTLDPDQIKGQPPAKGDNINDEQSSVDSENNITDETNTITVDIPSVVTPPVVAPPVVAPPVVAPPVVAPPVVAPPVVAPPVVAPPVVTPPVVTPPVVTPPVVTPPNSITTKAETTNETTTTIALSSSRKETTTINNTTKIHSQPSISITDKSLSVKISRKVLYINSTAKQKSTFLKATLPKNYTVKYFNCSPKTISLNKKTGKVTALKTGKGKIKINFYHNKKYIKTQFITVSIKKVQKKYK